MEYKDLPEAISSKKGMFHRISRAISEIQSSSSHRMGGVVGVKVGDSFLQIDSASFISLLEKNQANITAELVELEDANKTLTKVAAGLLK